MSGNTTLPLGRVLESERIECAAWTDVWLRAPSAHHLQWGLKLRRVGAATVFAFMRGQPPSPRSNRVCGLGSSAPAREQELDEAVAELMGADARRAVVMLLPDALPQQMPQWLSDRGFSPARADALMWRNDAPPGPVKTDLHIERIGRDRAQDFTALMLRAGPLPECMGPLLHGVVGAPDWAHYMAFDGSVPVATAARFDRGQGSWLGMATTLPAYRSRGAQSAFFARRIQDGLARGSQWFSTETAAPTAELPNPSYRNMLRAGFQLARLRANWVLQQSD